MKAPDSLWRTAAASSETGGPAGDDFASLAEAARSGCAESAACLVERCRSYLLLIANRRSDPELRVKVAASDLVQETLWAAGQGFNRFNGTSESELRLWLRRILLNKLAGAWRSYYETDKRNLDREQSLFELPGGVNELLALAGNELTPREHAIANEQVLAIERTMARLPDRYREVIRLRCFDLASFPEIGQALETTSEAVRKLWCRAIERLRQEWDLSDESR